MTHSTVFKTWSIVSLVFFTSVFSLKAQEYNAYNDRIIQNIDSREKMTYRILLPLPMPTVRQELPVYSTRLKRKTWKLKTNSLILHY